MALDKGMACGAVSDGLPVGAGWGHAKQVGGHCPHARFPPLVRTIVHGGSQQIQGRFEVATEALYSD